MEKADEIDSWLGKPPERPKAPHPDPIVDVNSDVHVSDHNRTDSEAVTADDSRNVILTEEPDGETEQRGEELYSSDDDSDVIEVQTKTPKVYVEVPQTVDDEEDYEYLPGHYKVQQVLSEYKGKGFLVKLQSGEADLVSPFITLSLQGRSVLLAADPLI